MQLFRFYRTSHLDSVGSLKTTRVELGLDTCLLVTQLRSHHDVFEQWIHLIIESFSSSVEFKKRDESNSNDDKIATFVHIFFVENHQKHWSSFVHWPTVCRLSLGTNENDTKSYRWSPLMLTIRSTFDIVSVNYLLNLSKDFNRDQCTKLRTFNFSLKMSRIANIIKDKCRCRFLCFSIFQLKDFRSDRN